MIRCVKSSQELFNQTNHCWAAIQWAKKRIKTFASTWNKSDKYPARVPKGPFPKGCSVFVVHGMEKHKHLLLRWCGRLLFMGWVLEPEDSFFSHLPSRS